MTLHVPPWAFWTLGPLVVLLASVGLAELVLLAAERLWGDQLRRR